VTFPASAGGGGKTSSPTTRRLGNIFLAQKLQELGAGIALHGEAPPEVIRAAVCRVLAEGSFRDAARRLGEAIHATQGAPGAATALERLARTPSAITG
jgi:UDP:flavonoid glycosyltransferase YjiC (YdhE family)